MNELLQTTKNSGFSIGQGRVTTYQVMGRIKPFLVMLWGRGAYSGGGGVTRAYSSLDVGVVLTSINKRFMFTNVRED